MSSLSRLPRALQLCVLRRISLNIVNVLQHDHSSNSFLSPHSLTALLRHCGGKQNIDKKRRIVPFNVEGSSTSKEAVQIKNYCTVSSEERLRTCENHTLGSIFPYPKQDLHNGLMQISSKIGAQHKVNFLYTQVSLEPSCWECTVKLSWPSPTMYTARGSTKSDAAEKASLDALYALKCLGVFNDEGGVERLTVLKLNSEAVPEKGAGTQETLGVLSTSPVDRTISASGKTAHAPAPQKPQPKKVKGPKVDLALTEELKRLDEEFKVIKSSLLGIFPSPKQSLHNSYSIISSQLGTKYNVAYNYNHLSTFPPGWEAKVSLTWPSEVQFISRAGTKSESADRAALKALQWLQSQGKINKKGEVELMVQMTKLTALKKHTPLAEIQLKTEHVTIIEQIVNRYYEEVLKHNETPLVEVEPNVTETPAAETQATTVENDDELEFDVESLPIERQKKLSPYVANRRDSELFSRYQRNKDRREQISATLPIYKYRDEIIQLVESNRVVVVKGEPGCGKSTQLPQYLMDWYASRQAATDCNIVVTQPRRISAISLADRVAYERNEQVGDVVGYHVRLDSVHPKYKDGYILFCSTGMLVRRVIGDPELGGVSHVIVDEAHERDTQVDFLMLMLKRALEQNPSLRVIIMSATINAELFSKFFNDCPSISIPGFTYPVEHFFLDNNMKTMLERKGVRFENEDLERPVVNVEAVLGIVEWIHENKPNGAILVFLPGWLEIRSVMEQITMLPRANEFLVVPAHSKLSSQEQKRIFNAPPEGQRKVILSTNIAETSLTINDVVYVVDSGAVKEERLDPKSGLVCLDNQWASQSNVRQRRGRAGRVKPGESYHLFSETKFNSLGQFPIPEINRIPLTRSVLDVKMYTEEENIAQFLSCLPEPPMEESVTQAVRVLQSMGALDDDENLTALGKRIYKFPMDPYLSKALVHACLFKCVNPLLTIVTLLSAEYSIFENTLGLKTRIRQLKQQFSPGSDHIATTRIYDEWENQDWADPEEAKLDCSQKGIIYKNMDRTRQLRQLYAELLAAAKLVSDSKDINDRFAACNKFSPYDELVKSILLTGLAKILTSHKVPTRRNLITRTLDDSNAVITPESVNSKFKELPSPFLTYFKSVASTERKAVIVHESSILSPFSVVLFFPGVMTMKNMIGLDPEKAVISVEGTRPISIVVNKKEGEQLLQLRQVIWNVLEYLVENEGQPKDQERYDTISQFRDDLLSQLANITREQGANIDYTESGDLRTEPTFVRNQYG